MASNYRVFHGLHNIAGIPSSLATFERSVGLDSSSVCYPSKYYSEQVSEFISGDPTKRMDHYVDNYDIFNFHFGNSFFGQSLGDLEGLKEAGKKIVLHYHGCDIRDSKAVLEKHPISACAECWPIACSANRTVSRDIRRRNSDLITVSTPDLLEFEPGSIWLPQAVSVAYVREAARNARPAFVKTDPETVYIVHAPSSSRLKGSRFVEQAVDRLRRRGVKVELVLLTGIPHETVLASIREADIVIDQLLAGAYGVLAIEAMALGKPTLCYIRDDLRELFPEDLPIVSGSIVNIESVILGLVEDRASWKELGRQSVDYANQYHDGLAVARKLADYYSQI